MGTYIGIDPGVSGGIAVLAESGEVIEIIKMPATDKDMLDALQKYQASGSRAMLEKVGPTPQMGRVSVWTFAVGYERIRMGLTACCIVYDQATPQTWQRALGCLSKGDKNVTKRRAQELFPNVKVTHANADALLIAEHGRRIACYAYQEEKVAEKQPRVTTSLF